MLKLNDEKNCCGCAACATICPKQCIYMEEGSVGHLFPKVVKSICILCGLCNKVCPINRPSYISSKQEAYAAYSIEDNVRFNGSSGGMFETFAKKLFHEGYVVYGASFDNNLKLSCTFATDDRTLTCLTKSKYLQSYIAPKFNEIQNRLKTGENVLIVSTPCQIAALKSYLKIEYKNLITVDFFCHGVPSQRFFDECIEVDEKFKYGGKVVSYSFRTKKKNGSTPHYFTVKYTKNGILKTKTGYYFDSTFYAFFQRYICFRESCYNCKYAGRKRHSDITIGDFHDINKYVKGINRFDGVSTVIINTKKGKTLFDRCSDTLKFYEFDLEQLISDGVCFLGGTKRPKNRDEFLRDYELMTTDDLAKKYVSPKRYRKMRIYYTLPRKVREIVKKYIGE